MMNYQEWRDFLQKPEAVALMPYEALAQPCPKCGEHKGYGVTSDGFAYCNACSWGTGTDFPFTNWFWQVLDENGNPKQEA